MPLTPPQKAIFDDPARFRVVSAGRRFGKTYLSMWEIARVARFPNKRIYYVAPTFRMAKEIIWNDLKHGMFKRNWAKRANESDLSIELVNGSKVSLRSADNPDSMRGVSLDLAVLDECAFMQEEVWTQVLRPTLSDRQGSALFISTPNGKSNWFYDRWTYAHNDEDWSAYQYTTIQGGNVKPEEVEAAKRDLDIKTFRQEYEASFETAGTVVFYNFENANIQKYTEELPRHLHIGMDFNVGKFCATVGVQTRTGLHIVDEIVIPNSHTDEAAREILARYPNTQITVYPDPAGAQRKTSAMGKTDHTILQEYGFKLVAPRRHDPVKDGVNAVNRLLCDATGERKLYVDPKCKETIECFNKFEYKPGTVQPDKDSGYDHMPDAARYLVSALYPIRKTIDVAQQPQTFGHF
jgi:phage terminase large subunit